VRGLAAKVSNIKIENEAKIRWRDFIVSLD
jgi:hypothetical protein